jgi:hypothetical protein
MKKLENKIRETLDSLRMYVEAHDGFAEMGEIMGDRVTIYCGGQCTDCEPKCIEDAIKERVPDIEVVFR